MVKHLSLLFSVTTGIAFASFANAADSHAEHKAQQKEHANWVQEHKIWQKDHERARAALASLQKDIDTHEKAIAEHARDMDDHEARIKAHEEALKSGKHDAAVETIHKEQAAKHREHKKHHEAQARHHVAVMDIVKRIERLEKESSH